MLQQVSMEQSEPAEMIGSIERAMFDTGIERGLLDLREGRNEELRQALMKPRLERFIGVIYRPNTERWSHYSNVILSKQFDAYVWFRETKAVVPLGVDEEEKKGAADDLY